MAYVYRAVRVEKPEWEKIPAVTLTHQPWPVSYTHLTLPTILLV